MLQHQPQTLEVPAVEHRCTLPDIRIGAMVQQQFHSFGCAPTGCAIERCHTPTGHGLEQAWVILDGLANAFQIPVFDRRAK